MNVSRVSQWMCCALLAVLVGGFGNRALGQGGGGDAPPLLDAKRMRLQPEEMVAPLKIFGDSSKEGFYIVQLMGYGPVNSVQTEVDEKGNPIGNNPKNPNRGRGAGTGAPGGAPSGRGRQ